MFKIKNVIILAAGRGSRMLDLCDEIPKPLLKINGKPMIESIIEYFIKKGIKDISIVVGYKHEQFNYLESKYKEVSLYFNDIWDKGNNITSLMKVVNKLGDTLVINGDVLILKDCIVAEYETSCTYAENNSNIDEWFINLDQNNNIINFDRKPVNKIGLYQREVTIINKELATKIKEEINNYTIDEYYELLVLDTAKKYNIPFKPYVIDKEVIFDIDNKDTFMKYIKEK